MTGESQRVSLRAVVSGIVQGVFFRAFVQQEATRLGLQGRVRNTPDGKVEVEAEGDKPSLEKLVERLRQGPPSAEVSEVSTEWLQFRNEYRDFRVDYH